MTLHEQDELIRKVFAVALTEAQRQASSNNSGEPVTLMAALAKELEAEYMGDDVPSFTSPALLLNQDSLDRLVVARLIESPPADYPQAPLAYLVRCYGRAADESRARPAAVGLAATAQACKELAINYAALTLGGGIIPAVGPVAEAAEQRGALQLLDCLDARLGFKAAPVGAVPLPHGFLEDLAAKFEADGNVEGLQAVVGPIAKELARRVRACSALGDCSVSLGEVRLLVSSEPVARALVGIREFCPNLKDITGRGIEAPGSSWLGPCFCPGPIDDPLTKAKPSVAEQCFASAEERPADVGPAIRTLQLGCKTVRNDLNAIVKALLGKSTRPAMVKWLAAVVEGNAERGKMQWALERGASHNFFLNHNAIMLALAGPFMESQNFWKRVDVRFVASNSLLDFTGDTKLGASTAEDEAYRERINSSAAATTSGAPGGGIEYHFICECFFLTLKSLRFGVIKMLDDMTALSGQIHRYQAELAQLEAEAKAAEGTMMGASLGIQVQRAKAQFRIMHATYYSYASVLQDEDFMQEVLSFYRLVATWLLSVANPGVSGAHMMGRLPNTPPLEFTTLPEYFLEDIVDVLTIVSRTAPQLLGNAKMDDIMLLMLATMDQPKYVRSSHMRAKMAEILHIWLPDDESGRTRRRGGRMSTNLSHLFSGHPVVCERLVPSLLVLYVDVEAMDMRNSFYEKFTYRQYIGEILSHLWQLPPHREAWKKFADSEGTGSAGYVRFANMLITDATYLLDESLKKVEEIRDAQKKLDDPHTTASMGRREMFELEGRVEHAGAILRSLLGNAQVTVGVMNFSTEEVSATFLLPEMVGRTATMLNYFMSLLTGPQRKKLALKEPEKYGFRPRELLLNLLHVYLHLSDRDRSGVFYKAVANDPRSYSETMFAEAARVLSSAQMLSPVDAAKLDQLDRGVRSAVAVAAEEEDLLQGVEVPDEFQDPLMAELMEDPVLLPTSGTVMDRAHITRHLLTDQRDPMSRAPLTPDQLVPQPELKARIEEWIRTTRAAKLAARQQAQKQ